MTSVKHRNSIHLLLILLCTFFLIFSCSNQNKKAPDKSDTEKIILGFSQIGAESNWRIGNTRSIKAAAQENDIQLLFDNAEQQQEKQIKAIRSFIAYQVDVIAFVPIVADGWDHVLQEAKDAGIPVLVTDREIHTDDPDLYAGFIGTDSLREGREAGLFLLHKFADRRKQFKESKKYINIVELSGTVGSSVAIKRAIGFREVIDNYPEFKIIKSASGDFLRSKGYELMRSILGQYRDIDVVFSHNDGMTLGILDAMTDFDIRPGKDIAIVTIDAEQAIIDALREGRVNCSVECNPLIGPDVMTLVRKLAAEERIPHRQYVDLKVFTETDELANIGPRGY